MFLAKGRRPRMRILHRGPGRSGNGRPRTDGAQCRAFTASRSARVGRACAWSASRMNRLRRLDRRRLSRLLCPGRYERRRRWPIAVWSVSTPWQLVPGSMRYGVLCSEPPVARSGGSFPPVNPNETGEVHPTPLTPQQTLSFPLPPPAPRRMEEKARSSGYRWSGIEWSGRFCRRGDGLQLHRRRPQ
jgi:hypothetical protein